MTLIALTVNNVFEGQSGYPVLMGDILFSSQVFTGNIPTPTYAQGTEHLYGVNSKYYPVWLKQKLYVINDRLCVALGGKQIQMETFLNRLKAIYSSVDFDDTDLWEFVDEFGREEGAEMIAIVLKSKLISENKYDFQVRSIGLTNEDMVHSRLYGTVVASGTGAERFLKFIKADLQFGTDITNTDAFLASNQSLIAHFLGKEVANGETLSEYWGAGFEMIYQENGKFVKLNEYTVVIMDAPFGKDILFEASPRLVMMITYENDVMIIKTVSDQVERNFCIPSIVDKKVRTIEKDLKPEKNALLMSYIFRHVDDGDKKYHCATIHPRNIFEYGKSPVVFERDKSGKISISIDPAQDRYVLKAMLEGYGVKVDLKEIN